MDFKNVYEDSKRAESYARLELPGTYYLAYRDIPSLIEKYARPFGNKSGRVLKALDFGCGTGRSTRFLKNLGIDAAGADISADMIRMARNFDPPGRYILLKDGWLSVFEKNSFDLITAIFTFDNIPGAEHRAKLLSELGSLLSTNGIILLVDSTPEIYLNEWLSFSTKDFPENRSVKSGGKVKIIMTDVEDRRPVEDIVWFKEDYNKLFTEAGLKLVETVKPLGLPEEPYEWINETSIAPWVVYVLKK
jgi:SAM-dependent methyltransferase